MNFRVALQYEFTNLGLDECLERLRNHESDELAVQVIEGVIVYIRYQFACCSQSFGRVEIEGIRPSRN